MEPEYQPGSLLIREKNETCKKNIQNGGIGILGIEFDQNSSFRKGPASAPKRIRESYFSDSSNLWSEKRLDLGSIKHLYDLGNIDLKKDIDNFTTITDSVKNILDQKCHLICLGGAHHRSLCTKI